MKRQVRVERKERGEEKARINHCPNRTEPDEGIEKHNETKQEGQMDETLKIHRKKRKKRIEPIHQPESQWKRDLEPTGMNMGENCGGSVGKSVSSVSNLPLTRRAATKKEHPRERISSMACSISTLSLS